MSSAVVTGAGAALDPRRGPANDLDRLGLTVFLALALHAIIILGISFNLADPAAEPVMTMEITLVQSRSEETPEDAAYLAQANQLGGGNVEEKVRAASPFSNPVPTQEQGFAPESRPAIALPPQPEQQKRQEVMTTTQADMQVREDTLEEPTPPRPEEVSAAHLFESSASQAALLAAQLDRAAQMFQVRPRHKHINGVDAREYRFASYLDAWRAKVERIGNINYPQEAVNHNLTGSLLLDVGINTDGTVHNIKVLRPSGHSVLDDAARRIVELAAPFPPLPESIRRDTDILHITRVWRFKSGAGLFTTAQ